MSLKCFFLRFSLYTPSMLSSAAIATAAALGMNTASSQDSDFDINELVRRLQILTRVDYVSSYFQTIYIAGNFNL